jgi:curved DNA-binding protein CbpA
MTKNMTREEALKILELTGNPSDREIKQAYRALSLKYHPDKNPSPDAQQMFQRVASAYEFLTAKDSDSSSNFKTETETATETKEELSQKIKNVIANHNKNYKIEYTKINGEEMQQYRICIDNFEKEIGRKLHRSDVHTCHLYNIKTDNVPGLKEHLDYFKLKITNTIYSQDRTIKSIKVSNGEKTIEIPGNIFSFKALLEALKPVDISIPKDFNEILFATANPEILRDLKSPAELFSKSSDKDFAKDKFKISPFFDKEEYLKNLQSEYFDSDKSCEVIEKQINKKFGTLYNHFIKEGCAQEISPHPDFDFNGYRKDPSFPTTIGDNECLYIKCIGDMLNDPSDKSLYCHTLINELF